MGTSEIIVGTAPNRENAEEVPVAVAIGFLDMDITSPSTGSDVD